MSNAPMNTLAREASVAIITLTGDAITDLNTFTSTVFITRGGRIGSGMGGVIEALWGFHTNNVLRRVGESRFELGWIYGHEYNDFACVKTMEDWNPATKEGELFRVEAKSMVASADESKAHFDRLQHEFEVDELLAVFLWDWVQVTNAPRSVYPAILGYFVGYAKPIAELRDLLHLDRGGTFVVDGACPDGCARGCTHVGEPLNASGFRERKSGPISRKGPSTSYMANFGGMLRMLGTRTPTGRDIIKHYHANSETCAVFLDFMGKQFARVKRRLI